MGKPPKSHVYIQQIEGLTTTICGPELYSKLHHHMPDLVCDTMCPAGWIYTDKDINILMETVKEVLCSLKP